MGGFFLRKSAVFPVVILLILCFSVSAGATVAKPVISSSSASVGVIIGAADDGAAAQPTAAPVENADFSFDAELGYDGLVIMNRWLPAFVTVTNNGPDFDGLLCVNLFLSKTAYDRYEVPLTLARGATKRVPMPVKPMTKQDTYAFELTRNGEIVAETRIAPKKMVAPETLLIGVLSDTPEALAYMNQTANSVDTMRGEVWLTVPLTPETFPDTSDLMRAFSMLVVDGADMRTMTEAQQDALTDWIRAGGVVFVSGGAKAADGYPFFAEWMGLSGGKPSESEDITAALSGYVAIAHQPLGENVWLSEMPASAALVSDGEQGLISMRAVGEGMILSAAFDMGAKPMAGWVSMGALWPRLLRTAASTLYQTTINRAESAGYSNDYYQVQNLVSALRVPNTESGFLVILLLVIFLILVGFGGYVLLKRFDRREFLWIAAPLCALTFALLLFVLSRSSEMNKPVALTASRVYIDSEGPQVTTFIGIATPDNGEHMLTTDQKHMPLVLSDSYYGDDGVNTLYHALDLRQRYRLETRPKVGFVSDAAWDAKMLKVDQVAEPVGGITGRIWMEADGVHGEVVNRGDTLLTGAVVLTQFGFALPGDVLPGQTASFVLKDTGEAIDTNDPEFTFQPNVLYASLDVDAATGQMLSYGDMIGSFVRAALYGNSNDYSVVNQVASQKEAQIQLFQDVMPMYGQAASYYCFAFNDRIGRVSVMLDDALVSRTAHTAVLGAKLTFEPFGPTGEVFFHPGLIPAEVVVDMGGEEKPRLPNEEDIRGQNGNQYTSRDNYLQIGGGLALRFLLPKHDTFTIERMTFSTQVYDNPPALSLYNHETQAWDGQTFATVSMDGEGWRPYIDLDGSIYARFEPNAAGNRYDGVNVPSIALKGTVK